MAAGAQLDLMEYGVLLPGEDEVACESFLYSVTEQPPHRVVDLLPDADVKSEEV